LILALIGEIAQGDASAFPKSPHCYENGFTCQGSIYKSRSKIQSIYGSAIEDLEMLTPVKYVFKI
jgi:hypothetical protein